MEEIKNQDRQIANNMPQGDNASKQYQPLQHQPEYIQDIQPQQRRVQDNGEFSDFTKRIKRGAWFLMAAGIAAMIAYSSMQTSTSVDTSDEAVQALESHVSTSLAIGTKLASKDEYLGGGDVAITHGSKDENTTIWIWDYASEDGDYVQVLVDGVAISDAFMIKNKPVSFEIPTVAEVQVIGTRDGGGGITYAVHYGMNETTYFNGMDEGNGNTYTLIRE